MAAMVRPSLILKMDFDERAYNDEVKSEIKRSYSYVAPSLVETHEATDGRPENAMRFAIKVHRPYWDKNDEAAEELWEGSIAKWLQNMLAKVSNTIVAANRQHADRGEPTVDYAWFDLEFGDNLTIRVKLNGDSSIPTITYDLVEAVRDAACAGQLGENPVLVSVPSQKSWAAQLAQVEAELEAKREAEVAVAAEDAAADDVVNPDLFDDGVEAAETQSEFTDVEAELAEEKAEETFLPLPEFDVDYSVWGVQAADGIVREFDTMSH